MSLKIIPVPDTAEARERVFAAQRRKCALLNVLFYIFLALSIAGFLGAIVTIIVFEFKNGMASQLCYILLGSFLGGGAVSGGLAYLFSRLLKDADEARLDYAERCDSAESFYVGEGTLATFEKDSLLLHGENGSGKAIRIPYAEVRLFSVCTRTAPKEKGEWSVVLELPSRYLAKDGKAGAGEKILVQTDAKQRLFDTISAHGLTLLGEKQGQASGKKYTLKAKYFVPVADKRRRALIMAILGFAVVAGGIGAIFWNATIGSFLAVIGMFLGLRGLMDFRGAKSLFSVYEEGIFWRDANGTDRIFLKWEEVVSISRETVGGTPVLKVQCGYGAYHLPDIDGVYEYLKETAPDKMLG